MKAMLLFDLQTTRKMALQQIVIYLAVAVCVSIGVGSVAIIAPMFCVMAPITAAFTLLALDERAKWEQFRLALPLTRGDIVRGRYASLALWTLYGVAIGMASSAIILGAAAALPQVEPLAQLAAEFDWAALPLVAALPLPLAALMLGITLPFVVRFGMTKAVRWIPLAFVALLLAYILGGGHELAVQAETTLQWVFSPGGTPLAIALALLAAAAIYAASCAVSCKLYERREF